MSLSICKTLRKHGRKLRSCWCLRSNPPFPFCHFILSSSTLRFSFFSNKSTFKLGAGMFCAVTLKNVQERETPQNDLFCFVINFPLGDLNIRNPRFRRNSLMCSVSHFLSFFPPQRCGALFAPKMRQKRSVIVHTDSAQETRSVSMSIPHLTNN